MEKRHINNPILKFSFIEFDLDPSDTALIFVFAEGALVAQRIQPGVSELNVTVRSRLRIRQRLHPTRTAAPKPSARACAPAIAGKSLALMRVAQNAVGICKCVSSGLGALEGLGGPGNIAGSGLRNRNGAERIRLFE